MVQRSVGMRLQTRAVLAGVVVAVGLAACSNGTEAGTLDPQSYTGVRQDVGDLRIRNAVLVADESGGLTVSMTIVNAGTTEDSITELAVTGEDEAGEAETVSADLTPGSISLGAGAATVIPTDSRPRIDIDLEIVPGGYAPVTVQFEGAGLVELSLPVVNESNPHSGG